MEHTKEPWRVEKVYEANYEIFHDHGANQIAVTATAITVANARRIVACVNACAGIPTEGLEKSGFSKDVLLKIYSLTKQRDELVACLAWALDNLYSMANPAMIGRAKEVLEKAKGGA